MALDFRTLITSMLEFYLNSCHRFETLRSVSPRRSASFQHTSPEAPPHGNCTLAPNSRILDQIKLSVIRSSLIIKRAWHIKEMIQGLR